VSSNDLAKADLRRSMLAQRQTLSANEVRESSLKVLEKLIPLLHERPVSQVLFYYPIRNEVDPQLLTYHFWGNHISTLLPHTTDQKTLEPVLYDENSVLRPGRFGIPEPVTEPFPSVCPDLILVPCVACDRQKHRLGYGQGYYDRYLVQSSALKVGLCYDFQLVDKLPVSLNDIALDVILTESEILK
jgi:5-formyltetrahydrofolate cyclo-ligase